MMFTSVERQPALESRAGETIELYALAAGFKAKTPSERAHAALKRIHKRKLGAAIQRALKRLALYAGPIDGIVGAGTRAALARAVPGASTGRAPDVLVELLHKEWIAGRPRLDLL